MKYGFAYKVSANKEATKAASKMEILHEMLADDEVKMYTEFIKTFRDLFLKDLFVCDQSLGHISFQVLPLNGRQEVITTLLWTDHGFFVHIILGLKQNLMICKWKLKKMSLNW